MHWLCLRKYYYAISGHILIALARALSLDISPTVNSFSIFSLY